MIQKLLSSYRFIHIIGVIFFCVVFLTPNHLDAQNINYQVDIDNLFSSECGDCNGPPDYRYFFRLRTNGGPIVVDWNPYYEDNPFCAWIGEDNLSFYDGNNVSFNTFVSLEYRAYEEDPFQCDNPCFLCFNGGPDDGTCVNYESANGNLTLTSLPANVWHSFQDTRDCTDDGVTITWGVLYSYLWNYVPILAPSAPQFTGTGCALALVPTSSTQNDVTWYWQTSPTGTSTANPASNPPSVPNGASTYYLRPRGDNSNAWGPASTALNLNKTCDFWCVAEGPVDPAIVGPSTNNGRTSSSPAGNGTYQNSFIYTGDFASNSLIIDVNTTVTNFGPNMELFNGVTSTSLVNGNTNWTNWDGQNPLNTMNLAIDNGTASNIDPGNVSVEVCACKPATFGTISSSTGATACPNEGFTLSHNGSTSNRLDEQGYGEEIRWFTGSCGGTQVGTGLTPFITGPGIETTITYYAQFFTNGVACGGCRTYTVTYVDDTPPVVVCSNETEFVDATCGWTVPNYIPTATISDNCVSFANLTITQTPAAGTFIASPGASQTVVINVNDGFGNSNSCSINVTLLDNLPPNAVCQNFTLFLDATGNGTLLGTSINNGSTDNCGIAGFTVTPNTFDCTDAFTTPTVALTVTDINGNTSSCNATVSVFDNIPPTAICQNYTLVLDAAGNGTLTVADVNNGSNDACGIANLSINQTVFTCAFLGPNTVTLTVTDNNGNISSCNSTVTVVEAPPTAAFAGNDIFSCAATNVTLAANPALVGTGTWTWSGPGTITYITGNANTNNAVINPSVSGVYTGTWTIQSNCSSSSDDVVLGYNVPDEITTTALASGQCTSNGLNEWVHIFDPTDGRIIASVDDEGYSLGNVNVTALSVGNASLSTVCANGLGSYMGRSFRFFSSNTAWYGNTVKVRLYFTPAELTSLITNSHTTNPAPGWDPSGCEDDDDVNTINDLYATKYAVNGTAPGSPGGILHTPVARGFDAQFNANYVELDVTSFSDFYLHGSESGVPLPVELTAFEANAVNNQFIKLNWTTATEINNAGFEIERSNDGVNFDFIAWSPGYNNSNIVHNYSYQDNEVGNGIYYYRLKQVDNDGQFEYSPIRSAEIKSGRESVSVGNFIPNPAENESKLTISISSSLTASIIVYDNLGKIVDSKNVNLEPGKQDVMLNTSAYASGAYAVRIQLEKENFMRKLIIKK